MEYIVKTGECFTHDFKKNHPFLKKLGNDCSPLLLQCAQSENMFVFK